MPGIRVDRFVASTAVVLLLSAACGAVADPLPGTSGNATIAAPVIAAPVNAAPVNAAPAGAAPAGAVPASAAPLSATDSTPTVQPAAAQNASPAAANPVATPKSADSATVSPAPTAPAPAPEATAGAAAAAPATAAPSTATASPPATSSPQTAAAPPAPPPSPDVAIADQLHGLADGKFDHAIAGKKERTQIDAFYAGRNYQPLWISDGKANARATAAIAYLGHVDADGLFPSDYPVPDFATLTSPADLANAEIELTASVITYAHHASIGRVAWSRVSADIAYDRSAPEPADVLATIVDAKDVAAALDSYEPKTPGYLALKAKLAEIRAGKLDKNKPSIATGPVLKIGMQDDRVPQLRELLGVPGDGGTTYDKALAEAVKKFQHSHQIAATGTLTTATIDAINGPRPDHVEDVIIANMERWRWAPHQFPDTYVIVNLPDFSLRVMHDGKEVWTTKIVIGKPDTATPLMTADMKFITVNPTWNVPPSIINNEYLPALAQDPTVLDRMGLKIARNPDGSVHIWQPPGDGNALGRIRFNFPNKFLVYQHDTPDKYLFAYAKRAYSHGCMRVLDPARYAEVLLSLVRPGDGYTEERIKKMFGPSEVNIDFPTYVPVNLTYQTAFVDSAGKLEFRDDVYGRDKTLLAILKGDRKDADIPIEHREDISHREVLAMPDQPSLFGGHSIFSGGANYYPDGGSSSSGASPSGGNFFARLFSGFAAPPPPPAPKHRVASHSRKVSRSGETVER
jgi:murein L,D-transpeptidase YcbB/YkuD